MEITTKKGHKVVYKSAEDLSAREWREMKGALATKSKASSSANGVDPNASLEMEDEVMRRLIVSVNGSTEKAFDILMSTLNAMEYEDVKTAVADIFDALTKK